MRSCAALGLDAATSAWRDLDAESSRPFFVEFTQYDVPIHIWKKNVIPFDQTENKDDFFAIAHDDAYKVMHLVHNACGGPSCKQSRVVCAVQ